MPRWIKYIIAVLLLPVCVGAADAVGRVVRASGDAETVWVALLAGAGCWLAIYLLLPKPMLVYVFGHELTHALWTWMMGGKVKKFKASSTGGHVVVTKNNFLITLAPYFFPLYSVLLIIVYAAGQRIWNWQPYLVWFHMLLGVTYSFHLTLTWHILKSRQSDILQEGYLFSAVVIFLGNAAVLLMAVPLLARKVSVIDAFRWCGESTAAVFQKMTNLATWCSSLIT